MQIKTLTLTNPLRGFSQSFVIFNKTQSLSRFHNSVPPPSLRFYTPKIQHKLFRTFCNSPSGELIKNEYTTESIDSNSLSENEEEEEEEEVKEEMEGKREGLENQSIWNQMKEIVMFTGPATGLWICWPLMSLIDTAVIGQGSSIELAALGICLKTSVGFLFLSSFYFWFAQKMW